MSCPPLSPLFGVNQVFSYGAFTPGGQINITLNSNRYYRPEGEGFLGLYGYDRYQIPEELRETEYSNLGNSNILGPSYEAPYFFSWQLQLLPSNIYRAFWAIFKRQQKEGLPCRLNDYRLVLDEPQPRRRAICALANGVPAMPGMDYFFPIFDIWLDFGNQRQAYAGDIFSLDFTAKEIDPNNPVPPSADLV